MQGMTGERVDLGELLLTTRRAAAAGASVAMKWFESPGDMLVEDKGGAHRPEPVTAADKAAEEAIMHAIKSARPLDAFLAEESGASAHSTTPGLTWVIDPIDATANFAAGRLEWAVSVAVVNSNNITLAACVLAPALGEEYWAVRGAGGFSNTGKLVPLSTGSLNGAVVEVGAGRAMRPLLGSVVGALVAARADVRRAGCASLGLCRVAAGLLDAMYAPDLYAWDTAAGLLVAHESGAVSATLGSALLIGDEVMVRDLTELLRPVLGF